MIIFLTLVLIMLMVLIGGERGAMSIMTLAGNIVILFFSISLLPLYVNYYPVYQFRNTTPYYNGFFKSSTFLNHF